MEACPSYEPWHDKQTARPSSGTRTGSACTTTSTSSTRCSACATSACPPGRRSGSSSTSTAITPGPQARPRRHRLPNDRQRLRRIDDWGRAQSLADDLVAHPAPQARSTGTQFCPVIGSVRASPLEPDAGRVRHRPGLPQAGRSAPLYERCPRTVIHAVKCEQVATFLGRQITPSWQEIGNDFSTRMEGTRIKHYMGPAAIKMYDKFGWCCGWKPPATTSPFSSTTAGWNIATGRGR